MAIGDVLDPRLSAERTPPFDARPYLGQLFGRQRCVYTIVPVRKTPNRPWRQHRWHRLAGLIPMIKRTEPPEPCRFHQLRSHRVALDVAAHDVEVFVALDREAFKPGLLEVSLTARVVMRVIAKRMRGGHPA